MTQYEPYLGKTGTHHGPEEEIDLLKVIETFWAGKWIMLAVTSVFAAGGVAYALYKPDVYKANVLMVAANEETGVTGIPGQLGGLASLAGINFGSGSSNQMLIAKEVLRSRAFLADFIDRRDLDLQLMAATRWDMERSSWEYDPEIYNTKTGQWMHTEEGESKQPTDWDLVKTFKDKHLTIDENRESGLVTLSVRSLSPQASKQWADWLVSDINEHMRRKVVAESKAKIEYLEAKLNNTSIAGMQQIFYQLIESETRKVMLANAQKEYVFETVDPAVIPQDRSEPNRGLIIVVATLLGGMSGLLMVMFRAFIRGIIQESKKA